MSGTQKISWNNPSTVSFGNALIAVQQLSYGSIKVRHTSESIDDIAIANDIAKSANNEKSECYNFLWTWEDTKLNNDGERLESPNVEQQRHYSCGEGIDLSTLY